jgi:hypothetical protein
MKKKKLMTVLLSVASDFTFNFRTISSYHGSDITALYEIRINESDWYDFTLYGFLIRARCIFICRVSSFLY